MRLCGMSILTRLVTAIANFFRRDQPHAGATMELNPDDIEFVQVEPPPPPGSAAIV